jgi:hypothetical protein
MAAEPPRSRRAGLPRALSCRRRQSGRRQDLPPGTRAAEARCRVGGAKAKPPGPCRQPVRRLTAQSLLHWDAATSVGECPAIRQEWLGSDLAGYRRSALLRLTGVLATWTGALPSASASSAVVGGSQSASGASKPTRLPPARTQEATAARLIATTPSRMAISQRGVLGSARRRRGDRQLWAGGHERNGRRCSWPTSDTGEHLREECPQPDDGAFRRCAEGVSMRLSTAGHASHPPWRRSKGVPKVCPHIGARSHCRPRIEISRGRRPARVTHLASWLTSRPHGQCASSLS